MKENRKKDVRQLRAKITEFTTRQDSEVPHISGYFAVFNSVYNIGPGMSESIARGAFSSSLGSDIRALTNHDTSKVLGRTKAGTLTLREDEKGLWGDISINPQDVDAMNTWHRVKRGDVSQCSIGFEILREDTEMGPDGAIHWTIQEVKLYEVSVCTFPAYEDTNISARSRQRDRIRKGDQNLEAWKRRMIVQLKGREKNE